MDDDIECSSFSMVKTKTADIKLPENVATLQQMVLQLLADVDDLNRQLAYFKRYVFGRRSEKLDCSQLILFEGLSAEAEEPPQQASVAAMSSSVKKHNANHKGRRPLCRCRPETAREPAMVTYGHTLVTSTM